MAVTLSNTELLFQDVTFLDTFIKNEETDCILYSKEGIKFNIHKEILYQAEMMRSIVSSVDNMLVWEQ